MSFSGGLVDFGWTTENEFTVRELGYCDKKSEVEFSVSSSYVPADDGDKFSHVA